MSAAPFEHPQDKLPGVGTPPGPPALLTLTPGRPREPPYSPPSFTHLATS